MAVGSDQADETTDTPYRKGYVLIWDLWDGRGPTAAEQARQLGDMSEAHELGAHGVWPSAHAPSSFDLVLAEDISPMFLKLICGSLPTRVY